MSCFSVDLWRGVGVFCSFMALMASPAFTEKARQSHKEYKKAARGPQGLYEVKRHLNMLREPTKPTLTQRARFPEKRRRGCAEQQEQRRQRPVVRVLSTELRHVCTEPREQRRQQRCPVMCACSQRSAAACVR